MEKLFFCRFDPDSCNYYVFNNKIWFLKIVYLEIHRDICVIHLFSDHKPHSLNVGVQNTVYNWVLPLSCIVYNNINKLVTYKCVNHTASNKSLLSTHLSLIFVLKSFHQNRIRNIDNIWSWFKSKLYQHEITWTFYTNRKRKC